MTYSVTKKISFCYGHRLMNYEGKCKHLHGHDAIAEITLSTDTLDNRGMVIDFGDIKREIKAWIDQHFDHKMLLHKDDPIVPILKAQGEPLYLLAHNPTAERIAECIYHIAAEKGLPVTKVCLWESGTSCASYTQ